MMRQSSSRNQRSKGGLKMRHFIQICLLLAICIWLVYQVKHSHDKKRAFEGRKVAEDQPLPFRFGRKDIPVVEEKTGSETRSIDEDEAEEREDEELEQDMKNEDAQDEEGRGGVDDWIDEQDQDQDQDHDQRGEENEQGEFTNEEEIENLAEEVDSGLSLEHEQSAVNASAENYKNDNVSLSVAHEIHLTALDTGNAVARALDEKNPGNWDADLKGNSSNGALAVSNFDDISAMRDFTGSMTNLSSISMGENITLTGELNQSMNGTSTWKSGSDLGDVYQKELQTNSTTASSEHIANSTAGISESLMATTNNSSVVDSLFYREILGNETSKSVPFEDQKLIFETVTSAENHTEFVEMKGKSKTREKQESEEEFTTASFSKNKVVLLHNAVTEEEREALTDLSTLPVDNDARHDYDVTAR